MCCVLIQHYWFAKQFVTENRILVIDESVAPLNIIKSHIKYDEYPKGSVAVASSVSNRGVSRIIDKTGSKVIVGEFPEIARYVYYSKATIWIASALKHSAVFQRLYSELRKMHIPVKHISINSGRKTGMITIQQLTNSKHLLSKNMLDNKLFRPKDHNGENVVVKDGLVFDIQFQKTIQFCRYFRNQENVLVFTRSPNSTPRKSIYGSSKFRNPYDVKYIHEFDEHMNAKARDDAAASGSVSRYMVANYNHFSKFEKRMKPFYIEHYETAKPFTRKAMEYDRYGLAKSNICAGLNDMSSFNKIVFIAPMIINIRHAKIYNHLYPEYKPEMGILGSAMLQCLLRGSARDNKPMHCFVWGEEEVRILKLILDENGIEYQIDENVLWPNWEVIENTVKRIDDGLSKSSRYKIKVLYEDILSGKRKLNDIRKSGIVQKLVMYLNSHPYLVSNLSKSDVEYLMNNGLGVYSNLV